jgi:hypothetical protein
MEAVMAWLMGVLWWFCGRGQAGGGGGLLVAWGRVGGLGLVVCLCQVLFYLAAEALDMVVFTFRFTRNDNYKFGHQLLGPSPC